MGTRPISFNQLTVAVEVIEKNLEALTQTVANMVQHISTGIPSKRDLDRIRQEIVLMKESGDYIGNQIGNINDADLRAMLELKPTLDNLLNIVNSFDDWKKVFNELIKNNIFYINISGGEPTQHPNFEKILEYLF